MAFERNSINALALGVNRDVDGTVDRVAEPPYEIWKMLAFLQRKCETENIEIISVFEVSVAWSCMYLLLLRRACHTAISHIPSTRACAGARRQPEGRHQAREVQHRAKGQFHTMLLSTRRFGSADKPLCARWA